MKRTISEKRRCRDGRFHWIPRRRTPKEREKLFWENVDRRRDCWLWQGKKKVSLNGFVYGLFWDGRRDVKAHRVAYRLSRKQNPGKLLVCHTCDTPLCVNPNHLFLGTYLDNNRDACHKGRHAVGERCPFSKLTEKQVREIRESKSSRKDLATQFGVSRTNIDAILTRRSWAHV